MMLTTADAKDRPPNSVYPQIISASSCFFGLFSIGLSFGWLSPGLSKLLQYDSAIPIKLSQISSVTSITVVGGIIGPILYAWKVDWIGRRWMAFIGSVLFTTSWIILMISTELYHIYLARILVGFGIGYTMGLVPTYIGEMAETHLRSKFGVSAGIMVALGTIFEFIVGPSVDFYALSYISVGFPILMFVSFFFMVESPYFLLRQGREEEAVKAVMKLRGQTDPIYVDSEVKEMKAFVENSPKRPFKELLKEVTLPSNKKAMLILTILMIGSQFSGSSTVKVYFHLIILETGTKLDANFTVIFIELVALGISISTIFFIEGIGRRRLFFISCIGCIFSTFLTGLYFMLKNIEVIGSETAWLALLGLIGIQCFSSVGSSVPTIIASEMSTASVRSWFGGYKAITVSVFTPLCSTISQAIYYYLNAQYSFWFLTCVLIVVTIVIYYILPETKGKNLQEIQDILTENALQRSPEDVERDHQKN